MMQSFHCKKVELYAKIEMIKRIERKNYLDKLIAKKWNGRIKIIAGLRRAGKSFLLFELFREHLISSGVKQENIITLALDSIENEKYTDPYTLYDYLKSRIADKTEEYYILLDEIQYAISSAELRDKDKPPRLYGVLNGLIGMKNADVYITGSNSRLLSDDIMTEFRGRGDVVSVYLFHSMNFFLLPERIRKLLSMIIFFMAGFRLFCRSIQWKTR